MPQDLRDIVFEAMENAKNNGHIQLREDAQNITDQLRDSVPDLENADEDEIRELVIDWVDEYEIAHGRG